MKANTHSVQIVKDNNDIKNNPKVKRKYPTLYEEVYEHDRKSAGSWYELSPKALDEYQRYKKDLTLGYCG